MAIKKFQSGAEVFPQKFWLENDCDEKCRADIITIARTLLQGPSRGTAGQERQKKKPIDPPRGQRYAS